APGYRRPWWSVAGSRRSLPFLLFLLPCLACCGSAVGARRLPRALATPAPEDDLGLFQLVPVIVARIQARGDSDGAVDVVDAATSAADEVVMVVSGAAFVTGRVAGGLDPPDQSCARTREQHVVDGLGGYRPDTFPHSFADLVGRGVRVVGEPLQCRLAWSGDTKSHAA